MSVITESRFLELARRGRATYASGGEAAAEKLAMAAIDFAPHLDDGAFAGFLQFVEEARRNPISARDSLAAREEHRVNQSPLKQFNERLLAAAKRWEKRLRCNCDLDNWEPERSTGHSCVCRIHKAAMDELSGRGPCSVEVAP